MKLQNFHKLSDVTWAKVPQKWGRTFPALLIIDKVNSSKDVSTKLACLKNNMAHQK